MKNNLNMLRKASTFMKLGIIGFALMIVLMIVFVIAGLAFSSMILMPVIIMVGVMVVVMITSLLLMQTKRHTHTKNPKKQQQMRDYIASHI